MIIRTVIFVAILIIISLLLIFLAIVFIPALKKQTNINAQMLFSEKEHNFEKLQEVSKSVPYEKKALVLCNCNKKFKKEPDIIAKKGQSCAVVSLVYGSLNDCKFSCIGLGDCIRVCEQEAISIENGTALINELCNGCGKCISACPKNIITLVPVAQKEVVLCSNNTQSLTSCDSIKKTERVAYPEKKGFKIWKLCYKILKKSL